MTDLFKKLNVLIKSSLNDLLPDDPRQRTRLTPERLGKDIDREVKALRGRVNEAIQYEETLQKNVHVLQEEIARWDQQADDAVAAGNDAAARYAIDQMRRAEQRLTMAESDLREHRLVTEDLMRRVNELEAVVADAQRSQTKDTPAETKPPAEIPTQAISDVLRNAREKIAGMGDLIAARDEVNTTPDTRLSTPTDAKTVDDDLEQRRQRLSKR